MKKLLTIITLSLCCTLSFAQKADLRKGNRQFSKGEFAEADISYRKGLLKDSTLISGKYNLANTLYREQNYDEAKKLLTYDFKAIRQDPMAPAILFNLGNVAIAQEDWNTAVEAYGRCLMLTPDDIQAKENYTFARYHLQNQNQNQDGDGRTTRISRIRTSRTRIKTRISRIRIRTRTSSSNSRNRWNFLPSRLSSFSRQYRKKSVRPRTR